MRIIFYLRIPASEERKKERKKERHVEILLCTKKSFHFIVPTHFSVARARHASSSFWLFSIIIGVHFDQKRKSVDLGTKSKKKKEQKSTVIFAL